MLYEGAQHYVVTLPSEARGGTTQIVARMVVYGQQHGYDYDGRNGRNGYGGGGDYDYDRDDHDHDDGRIHSMHSNSSSLRSLAPEVNSHERAAQDKYTT